MPGQLVLVSAALALATGLLARPAAQPATPTAGATVPPPAACRVAPRSVASLRALAATPPASFPSAPPAGSTPLATPPAHPADVATAAAVAAAVREVVACANAGDALRGYALVSDAYLRRLLAGDGLDPAAYVTLATPVPLPPAAWTAIRGEPRVWKLPDQRTAATVTLETPEGEAVLTLVFVKQAGRWLVDASSTRPVNSQGTPIALGAGAAA